MRKRKILSVALATAMVLTGTVQTDVITIRADEAGTSVVTAGANEDGVAVQSSSASGTCGENLTWEYEDGTLNIRGSGEMEDLYYGKSFWGEYTDKIQKVIIEEGVTNIGEYAFSECSSLTEVSIPDSVTTLEWCAFYQCNSLKSIDISKSVTDIDSTAFSGCGGLEKITVDKDNIVYDSRDNSNAIIETDSDTLMVGGENTIIPEGIKYIGYYAFENCSGLTNIEIPNSVTGIGYHAFKGCSGLTSIEIPESVTEIDNRVFSYCSGLEKITVNANNAKYDSRNKCNAIIETKSNKLIEGCKNTKIPLGVTSIDVCAFEGNDGLKSIEIPSSVTHIGECAYAYCTNVERIVVDKGNPVYDSRNNCNAIIETDSDTLMVGGKNTIIPEGIKHIGIGAFENCSGLTSIKIPESVTNIDMEAFCGCRGLTCIEIPKSVKSIPYRAFADCTGLTKVVIHGSVSIGALAFDNCKNLKSIIFTGNAPGIGTDSFCNVTATAYYPSGNTTWTEDVIVGNQYHGGNIKWVGLYGPKNFILPTSTYTYDGTAKNPAVTVKDSAGKVISSSNYTVTYSNNTNAGTATVKVRMKGKYTGTLTKNFTINKAANKITTTGNHTKIASSKAQSFNLNAKAKGGKITYKSNSKSVSVNSVGKVTIAKNFAGKATVTITAGDANYKTVTKTVRITVKPAKTKVISAKNSSSRKAIIMWSKLSYVSGYQIQYGIKSSMSGAKTITVNGASKVSKVITGIAKGKTYYVRIRTYKTVGNTKYYSIWSEKKRVRISK